MERVKTTLSNNQRLLELHQQHIGLYARVAKILGVSPGYVSLVASGRRQSDKIKVSLLKELRNIK